MPWSKSLLRRCFCGFSLGTLSQTMQPNAFRSNLRPDKRISSLSHRESTFSRRLHDPSPSVTKSIEGMRKKSYAVDLLTGRSVRTTTLRNLPWHQEQVFFALCSWINGLLTSGCSFIFWISFGDYISRRVNVARGRSYFLASGVVSSGNYVHRMGYIC